MQSPSPAGRVSELLSPKLCYAITASKNGPIELNPPKGSTDAIQSKAVPKFIVIPMKVKSHESNVTDSWLFILQDFCFCLHHDFKGPGPGIPGIRGQL